MAKRKQVREVSIGLRIPASMERDLKTIMDFVANKEDRAVTQSEVIRDMIDIGIQSIKRGAALK